MGAAFGTGYNWGANLFSGNGNDAVGAALSGVPYDELSGQLGDIAGSVGSIEKSVKMSDEDIKSLVDVAERRYVNNVNLTALTPVITVNGANTGADRRRPPEPRQCHPGHSDRADRLRLHAQHGAARKRIRKEEAGMSVNNFGLFFTRDGTVIRLPVNPEKLPVARDNDNSEYNVLGIGPIMIPRIPKLREVTISSFFPGREFSGSNQWGAFHPPEYYIQFFESAMNDKAPIIYTPVRYYENGEPFMTGDTGFEVLVTQFNTEERGGETGDFYYDLTLTEYRDYTPQSLSAQSGRQPAGMPGGSHSGTLPHNPARTALCRCGVHCQRLLFLHQLRG